MATPRRQARQECSVRVWPEGVDQGRPQTQVVRTDQDGRVAHVVVPHQLPEQLGYKCQVAREGALNGHARLDVAKFERQVTVAQ
jgi:hypothetical protein